MSKQYNSQQIEPRWVKVWEKEKTYKTPSKIQDPPLRQDFHLRRGYDGQVEGQAKSKIYTLSMFPYPSGSGLHIGHVRIYTGTDVLARYFRMKGYAVLHPMGWDAFGLPAENAAIKAKKNPMDMVPKNIAQFKKQMLRLGLSYDWDKELSTMDPDYYQWTQWLFIQFFKLGLLYKKDTPVYFCPQCQTGLAEEEVLPNGTHERCGKPITRKKLPQWLFKITDYADSLLDGLKELDWPKGILEMQKNWIGKKEGINITYPVVAVAPNTCGVLVGQEAARAKTKQLDEEITCFTTRPDTNFGATFVVIAPEHEFVAKLIKRKGKNEKLIVNDKKLEEIKEYVDKSLSKTDLERIAENKRKTGVFTGYYCLNQLNNKLMPIWISDFVLTNVGTGAVVGVPGHDQRDFQFAKEFGLEVIIVVKPNLSEKLITKSEKQQLKTQSKLKEKVYEGEGINVNSDFLNGLNTIEAQQKVKDYLEEKGWGKRTVSYHLRDWIFSRQRYWGEPIPMVFCPKCAKQNKSYFNTESYKEDVKRYKEIDTKLLGNWKLEVGNSKQSLVGWFPIVENKLPLELPYLKQYEPTKTGKSPLTRAKDWVNTTCPECGGPAKRETDTMPNWAGSCWYFLAFPSWNKSIGQGQAASMGKVVGLSQKNNNNNLNNKSNRQPNPNLFAQPDTSTWLPVDWYLGGAEHAVLHLLYARFWTHVLADLKLLGFREPFLKLRNVGMVLGEDHQKMSKSVGNVISPEVIIEKHGADALRLYEMFMAPFNIEISWSNEALLGMSRFINKVYQLYTTPAKLAKSENEVDKNLIKKLQKTILKVEKDITNVKFNTAVAAMMEFVNAWKKDKLDLASAKKFLIVLAPFTPFLAEEIWRNTLKQQTSIHLAPWPVLKKVNLTDEEITLPIQVNGKLRALVKAKNEELKTKNIIEKRAIDNKKVRKYLKGHKYKTVYVPGRVLNFITE